MIRTLLPIIFSEKFFEKIIAYALLGLIAWSLSDFLVLFFIIFICAYIFLEAAESIASHIHDWGEKGKNDTRHKIAAKYATTNIVVSILYVIFITMVTFIFINIVPKIAEDVREFVWKAPIIASQWQEIINKIQESTTIDLGLEELTQNIFSSKNLESVGQFILTNITSGGLILMKFLIGLALSYIFIIERKKIGTFLWKIRKGNFAFFYDEYAIVAKKIGVGFGVIFRAQSIIALVNSILTVLGLIIISFVHGSGSFPYIITLALVVLIFGFIPVFGTIISGIPIIIIAYGYGWLSSVLWVLVMLGVVHAVEAYYLNPKIVSSYVHFPVFITFLILTISEHFFGLIGLLIGVPLFSIFIGLVEDLDKYINSIKKEYSLRVRTWTNP